MKPAVSHIFRLRQGNQFIGLICRSFVEYVTLLDKMMCSGKLKDSLQLKMPEGKIPWSLAEYMDYVLQLSVSSFTVGLTDQKPRNPAVLAT
ncbi:MAG: hypothetical protein ACRC4N_00090 [Gammaproteobacteria bacterium]